MLDSSVATPGCTPDDINLLLLGETGVGKSTFINSITNYFTYSNFKKAQKGQMEVLIPVRLKANPKVHGTFDANESHESGKSATQQVKVYLFPVKKGNKSFNLRLVDTPGVGDPRGMEQDDVNLDNIFSYLATLKKLHAVCFILKSNQTRFTKFVEYCLKQILTRLDKSASGNIIFVTTYSKAAGYTAGETRSHCLEPLVRDIQARPPNVEIPLSEKNVFALDNEAFKALLEMQEGTKYSKRELESFAYSWNFSSKEIRRLLTYIVGDVEVPPLEPHDVENTIRVNEARFLLEQLASSASEIAELVQENLRLWERHNKNLGLEKQSLEELKKRLLVPSVDLQIRRLRQPVTVCTSSKCAEVVKVNGVTQWHYRQRCHNPCDTSGINTEIVGDPGLAMCTVMSDSGYCLLCGCHWKVHMQTCKETTKVQVLKEDRKVKSAIRTKEDARVDIETVMLELHKLLNELEKEKEVISDIVAKFSYFLQQHALTPCNDAYSGYVQQLIKSEQHMGKFGDKDLIITLQKLLGRHEHLQVTFGETLKKCASSHVDLNPEEVERNVAELFTLKHMGTKIRELVQKSVAARHEAVQKSFKCVVSKEVVLEDLEDGCEDGHESSQACRSASSCSLDSEDGSSESSSSDCSDDSRNETEDLPTFEDNHGKDDKNS